MAVFAVAITKSIPWRGGPQEFSNVYHFETGFSEPFDDLAVIADLVAMEKLVHGQTIDFVRARSWGPTDEGPAASVMREVVPLSGTGAVPVSGTMYRECAILISIPLGRYGTRNRPQYLRKWLHCDTTHGYDPRGLVRLTTPSEALTDYMDDLGSAGQRFWNLNGYQLCTADGRTPIGDPYPYPYLEHRQLG